MSDNIFIGNIKLPSFPLLLAPMEDISDPPFRKICKQNGADVMFSEFVCSEGLIKNAIRSHKKLDFFEFERPFAVQLFGGDEESMAISTQIVEAVNPDFIDINFGCPVKKIINKGAGAAVLKDIPKMVALTEQVVKSTHLPVTVKTRLGWDENNLNIEEVAQRLQDVGIAGLTIHGRTRCQKYAGVADWSLIKKVKDNPNITIPIFGNGDIDSPEKALEYKNKYGVDGIMIGRAAIGNPWIFNNIKHFVKTGTHLPPPTLQSSIEVALKHLQAAIDWKNCELQATQEMRKHYSNYFRQSNSLPIFKALKPALMQAKTFEAIEKLLQSVIK